MERSSAVLQGGRDEGILDFDMCRHLQSDNVSTMDKWTDIHTDSVTQPTRVPYGTNKPTVFYWMLLRKQTASRVLSIKVRYGVSLSDVR